MVKRIRYMSTGELEQAVDSVIRSWLTGYVAIHEFEVLMSRFSAILRRCIAAGRYFESVIESETKKDLSQRGKKLSLS